MVNTVEEKVDVFKPTEDAQSRKINPAAWESKLRTKQQEFFRKQFHGENAGKHDKISTIESKYPGNLAFDDYGIQMEPFNLEQEREEGYFDEHGYYVEYTDNKIKDAWLDSIEDYTKVLQKESDVELSSEEFGKIKRRIADALEPGETVLQARRRLKGTSNNKKEKMSPETQHRFNQLVEDARKLYDDGDKDVYEDLKENFELEAEGYERRARQEVISMDSGKGNFNGSFANEIVAIEQILGGVFPVLDTAVGPTNHMIPTDDESAAANATPDEGSLVSKG